jgi:nicotinate-nucleotide adenylyltransferase
MVQHLQPNPDPVGEPWFAHFGGSFNPIHDGHIAIARQLLQQYRFAAVIFCPNGDTYGKPGLAAEGDRLAMVRIATADETRFEVSAIEHGRDVPARTVHVLEQLHQDLAARHDRFRLFCVRGADAVEAMAHWRSLDTLLERSAVIVVPRSGMDATRLVADLPRLGERFVVLPASEIPALSSTAVRRALLEGRTDDLPVAPGVLEAIRDRGLYGLTAPADRWITLSRPSYSGSQKGMRDVRRDEAFGPGRWRTSFEWGDATLRYVDALQLYEDAYLHHLQANPDDLQWLLDTACDVYDNSETNVMSGLDYGVQESGSTHLQDIALRRCVMRLGLSFRGDHLVEVRGRDSEGYRFNPGEIPFHRPDRIVQPAPRSWWRPDSVEAFWQANKVLQVKAGAMGHGGLRLVAHLYIEGPSGGVLCLDGGGRPAGLPSVVMGDGCDLQAALGAALDELAIEPEPLRPVLASPIVDGDEVSVLWWHPPTTATCAALTEFSLDQLRSSRPGKRVMTLLKLAIKAGGGKLAAPGAQQ